MCWTKFAVGVWLLAAIAAPARGQLENVSETLIIHAASADHWSQNDSNISVLNGPVVIEMDNAKLTADRAVLWLIPAPGGLLEERQAQIVLMGNAVLTLTDNHVTRSGPELLVTRLVRGDIELMAAEQNDRDDSQEAVFEQADAIRHAGAAGNAQEGTSPASTQPIEAPPQEPEPGRRQLVGVALGASSPATTAPSGTMGSVEFKGTVQTAWLSDGTEAVIITNGSVTQARPTGDFLELQAARIVLFTKITLEESKSMDFADVGKKIDSAYLEEDVRIDFSPANGAPEQRMTADRAYYNLHTDSAIMTDVVFHTVDPLMGIPIVFRAEKVRQLAQGEYNIQKAQISSSSFNVPTYDIRTDYAYVHQVPDPYQGSEYDYQTKGDTVHMYGVPLFYFPFLSGTVNNDFPLRNFNVGNTSIFGTYIDTDWGLFETLGRPMNKDLNIDYRLDYYSERGFGGGIGATYDGGFIDDSTRQPWNFLGDFTSYIMTDKGTDNLGGDRALVKPPDELRGRVLWQHQHFFPDDWQVQVRAGYVSDPTFVEQYYPNDYNDQLPYDAEFYVKHQHDTEAVTLLASVDTTNFVTNAARLPDQTDIERLPEIRYQRIGDSIGDDDLTFFSDNSAARLNFNNSHATLADYGFFPGFSPGIASDGLTGTPEKPVYREDSRQELDWPLALGQIKLVPYTIGRVTEYSDSPGGDEKTRLIGGGGLRLTTTFWRLHDSVDSELFDLHRVRYVLQPELNLFSTGTTQDQSKVFDYDPNVDAISDVSAAQVAIHQRWETMRGGPDHWRSTDVLDTNVEANFFANQPPPGFLNPVGFRSLFFLAEPETSVPRQGINADMTWHLSDTTAFLADSEWNMDTHEQATASAGLAVSRDERLTYYFGDTYVQPIESQIISFVSEYQISSKYKFQFGQSFNFGDTHDINSIISVIRKFDTFSVSVSVYHDAVANRSGFGLVLIPLGAKGFNGGINGL